MTVNEFFELCEAAKNGKHIRKDIWYGGNYTYGDIIDNVDFFEEDILEVITEKAKDGMNIRYCIEN